jgi:hypothetical protein
VTPLRWQATDPLAGFTLHANFTTDQRAWRFRNDDGNQTSATWKAAQNTAITQAAGENFRLRFETQETGGGASNNVDFTLQYNRNGTGWVTVTTSSAVVRLIDSPFVADNTPTTNQLTAGTGTFLAGSVIGSSESTGRVSFAGSEHTEHEWKLVLVPGDVANGDTIAFRVNVNGAVTTTATAGNATLTTSVPAAIHDVSGTARGASSARGAAEIVTAGVVHDASGSAHGTSSARGDATRIVAVSGRAQGTSAATVTTELTGWVWSTGSPLAAIAVSHDAVVIDVSGSVAGTSSASGLVSRLLTSSGRASGTSTAQGSVSRVQSVSGSADGASSARGGPSALLGVSGRADGASTASATANVSLVVSGRAAGASSASGQAYLEEGGIVLNTSGSAAGTSSASATPRQYLNTSGRAAGSSSARGNPSLVRTTSARANGSAQASGAVVVVHAAGGTAAGSSTASGQLATTLTASGRAHGSSSARGSAAFDKAPLDVAGIARGTSSAQGWIGRVQTSSGSARGTASSSGRANLLMATQGSAAGTSSVRGAVRRTISLHGRARGHASARGHLVTGVFAGIHVTVTGSGIRSVTSAGSWVARRVHDSVITREVTSGAKRLGVGGTGHDPNVSANGTDTSRSMSGPATSTRVFGPGV